MAENTLTGKEEKVIRTVERTLEAVQSGHQQPGVKITNLSSGKIQIEVHAYDDSIGTASDLAMAEYARVMVWALAQQGLVGVQEEELQRLRWYASIGLAHEAKQEQTEVPGEHLEPDDFLAKLTAINAAGVQVTDAD